MTSAGIVSLLQTFPWVRDSYLPEGLCGMMGGRQLGPTKG